ncbi:MAG TPA: hypothetical protein VJ123_05145 [Anaerolineales bacterium]|nr:hypothetical protein [Anaerolineales bacterium]
MPKVLFLFLDGVGLGGDDPRRNPFAANSMPKLEQLLGGRRLLAGSAPYVGELATLLAAEARLGVEGKPQSATGQAVLLTGRNVPAEIGKHYGPKPDAAIAAILREDNLFTQVVRRGGSAALLNAYPPRYFDSIRRGHRLYSAIPLAVTAAGLMLMTAQDLQSGRALSADFTGAGWAAQPGFPPAPVYTPQEAGALLARLSTQYDLAWFDYWPIDYLGHRGTAEEAADMLGALDGVLGSLTSAWARRPDLVVITSDHGNVEDLGARGHTSNPVPVLLIGPAHVRQRFAARITDLTSIAEAVLEAIFSPAGGHDDLA